MRPYLKGIINSLKNSGTWKTQFTTTTNFVSSHDDDDNDEERVIHSKSDNIKIMINEEAELYKRTFRFSKKLISK